MRAHPERLSSYWTLPTPDLLLGAGHHTHLSLLAARRIRGGKVVVLMRPSLPPGLFDLCLIPEHDAPPARPNVLATRGALNRIQPAATLRIRRKQRDIIDRPSELALAARQCRQIDSGAGEDGRQRHQDAIARGGPALQLKRVDRGQQIFAILGG